MKQDQDHSAMTDAPTNANQLTGDDARALAARLTGGASMLGSFGLGTDERKAAIENAQPYRDHEIDMTNRPLVNAALNSRPSGKTPEPTPTSQPKPKTPGGPS